MLKLEMLLAYVEIQCMCFLLFSDFLSEHEYYCGSVDPGKQQH